MSPKENLLFLGDDLSPTCKPFKDLLEAKNHYQAVQYVLTLEDNDYDWNDYINANTMKSINSILLKDIESNSGEYKTIRNHVIKQDGSMHEFVDPIHVNNKWNNYLRGYIIILIQIYIQ